jgi:hypothetical protein
LLPAEGRKEGDRREGRKGEVERRERREEEKKKDLIKDIFCFLLTTTNPRIRPSLTGPKPTKNFVIKCGKLRFKQHKSLQLP